MDNCLQTIQAYVADTYSSVFDYVKKQKSREHSVMSKYECFFYFGVWLIPSLSSDLVGVYAQYHTDLVAH